MFDLDNDPLKDLREFFINRSEALQNTSALLGGQPGVRCVHAIMDDLAIQPKLTRRMERNLIRLHELLALGNVHDPDRIEAACFAEIDPSSPIGEDICLLSDEFRDQFLAHFSAQEAPSAVLLPSRNTKAAAGRSGLLIGNGTSSSHASAKEIFYGE